MRALLAGLVVPLALFALASPALGFGFPDVVEKARQLASRGYSAPPTIPRFMRDIGHDAWRGIRFDPARSLWREASSRFQIRMVSSGHVYAHPVRINVVDAAGVRAVPYQKAHYLFNDESLARRIPADLGHAGFEISWPLAGAAADPVSFASFAGASTFRVIGRNNVGGASARGVAVNTGLMSGEEFPAFREFWLERPAPDAHAMKFYGLLDGPSLTGAYQFVVYPGDPTRMQVEAVLYPRTTIEQVGIAPLAGMFMHGENTARRPGQWRPEAHDADGLLIHDGASGEWLWRPLINPFTLQLDSFEVDAVQGFGLLQRDTAFSSYQDIGAAYERRASAWVEPRGDWGKGRVMLVQLPTPDTTNDNVVAFWTPARPPARGEPMKLAYQLSFGAPDVARSPLARSVNTFVGDGAISGDAPGTVRFHVDFAGGPLDKLRPRAAVIADVRADGGGEIVEHFVEYNEAIRGWRMSILARAPANRPLTLRGHLRENDTRLSETWSYVLPTRNDILRDGR